jgi:hypothetical protein
MIAPGKRAISDRASDNSVTINVAVDSPRSSAAARLSVGE